MNWLRTLTRAGIGLFVDDGSLAVLVALWLVLNGVLLPHMEVPRAWRGVILFVGLAAILLESTSRYARRKDT